ncbi:MAG: hypothetical protein KI789_16775, partial [Hoeflea sp.]|nr:hypothetical protein [Hoeflea sp.]
GLNGLRVAEAQRLSTSPGTGVFAGNGIRKPASSDKAAAGETVVRYQHERSRFPRLWDHSSHQRRM